MTRAPEYPFVPRSNAYLEPGQFWAVPLSDGRYACGRVLAVLRDRSDPFLLGGTRAFFAGLMAWVGADPPTSEDLAGSSLIAQGAAHIKTIQETGGAILGHRDLAADDLVGMHQVTHRAGGTVYLYEGPHRLRPATDRERHDLPVLATWGLRVVSQLAERHFVRGDAIA